MFKNSDDYNPSAKKEAYYF